MKWAIDLDGVVANYWGAWARLANELYPGILPDGYQPTNLDLPEIDPAKRQAVYDRLHRTFNFWMSLDSHRENVRAIANHRIAHPSDEVYYVTARKPTRGMPVVHQSARWLEMCGIAGIGTAVICSHGNGDKHSILEALQIDAYVDDGLDEVMISMARGGPHISYLLDRPWNQDRWSGVRVVPNLATFFREAPRGTTRTALQM